VVNIRINHAIIISLTTLTIALIILKLLWTLLWRFHTFYQQRLFQNKHQFETHPYIFHHYSANPGDISPPHTNPLPIYPGTNIYKNNLYVKGVIIMWVHDCDFGGRWHGRVPPNPDRGTRMNRRAPVDLKGVPKTFGTPPV
jgi:hypothetical protein